MRPEEFNGIVEEALSKIKPKDEAERARIETLQGRLKEIHETFTRELDALQERSRTRKPIDFGRAREIAADRTRLAQERLEEMANAMNEQADLIERIAERSKRK